MSGHRVRLEVTFSGHVQGVGFRWQTTRVAREFEVAGTVRNQPDGTVFLIAEGDSDEVARFVDEVDQRMEPFVRETVRRGATATGEFRGFRIVHG